MRALCLSESSQIESHRDAESIAPRSDEVVVRPSRVLVSALDVECCRGLLGFRGVLGRDMAGVVEAIGEDVDREWTGARVVSAPIISCGGCARCRWGLAAQCEQRMIPGMAGRDGCLAEQFVIPARNLVRIPDSLEDERAVFANAVGAAMQSLRHLTIEGKPYITVLGDGLVGLLTGQIMARLNASVRVLGTLSERLNRCEKWGIKHRHVDDVGRRGDQDIVVVCSDSPDGIRLALRLVRPRGTIVMLSLHAPAAWRGGADALDLSCMVTNEVRLIGSFAGSTTAGLRALEHNEVDVVGLITHRAKLDDGRALLERAAQPEAIAVMVEV